MPVATTTSPAPSARSGPPAPGPRRLGPGALLALITAVAACLFTTYLTARSLARGVRDQAAERFQTLAERVEHEVHLRLSLFEHGLRGTRGVFNSSREVRRDEFHSYTESRDLAHEFIGMRSHGYVARVRRADLDAFVAANRADGAPDFTVRSEGAAPELFIIQFAEPGEHLRSLIGFDVARDPIRRDAVLRAMRSGEAVLTARVALLQVPRHPGVIYILPVYRHGMPTDTVAQREAACVGWIYFAIDMTEVLRAIPEVASGTLDLDLFDGPTPSIESDLYDADGHMAGQPAGAVDAHRYQGRLFSVQRTLHVGGRVWTLWLSSLPPFSSKLDYSGVTAVAILGSLLSLLVGGVIWTLGTARSRALGLARGMTGDLQAARDAAAERERLLRVIIDLLPQRVFWKDRAGRYLGCNSAFLQDTGLPDVVGRTDLEMPWRPGEAAWYRQC